MKIIYYITNDVKLVLDLLERELCMREISYVRVDNEIHFLNKIVRIFDIESDKEQIFMVADKNFDFCLNEFKEVNDLKINIKNKSYYKKNDFKKSSHNVNMILKRNIR